jgi:hypothetical protein
MTIKIFKKQQKELATKKALSQAEQELAATRAKTEKLRALRLEKGSQRFR